MNITILKSAEDIEGIRQHWEKLQYHPNSDISIFLNSLKKRKSVKRPHIIVIDDNGIPKTILVARVEEQKIRFFFGYKTVKGPTLKYLTINYAGVLGSCDTEESELLITELISTLKESEADIVFFNHLAVDSSLYRSATSIPNFFMKQHSTKRNPHWRMSLPENKEDLQKDISNKLLSQIRRFGREFSEDIKIVKFQNASELDQMVLEIEKIAKTTYHRGMGTGFLNDKETYERLKTAAENGWLRGYLLYIDSIPCAFNTGIKYGSSFFGEFTGYNLAYRKYSPGMYLFMRVFEDLCDEKVKFVDFGFGDADYKGRLANSCKIESTIHIFPATLKGIALNSIMLFSYVFNHIANFLSRKLKITQKLKRFWRDLLIVKAKKMKEAKT